ncbi:MAG: YfhO family protein [Lachnospiraceae bacterium]|nr:YfhO family protein [Lachnospiraceae bacterium]
MSNRGSNKIRLCLYLSSFFLPVILLIIVYALHGIYPFGDNTVMTGDMEYQFVDYLAYLKTIVFGNNDFAYSFSKNLGGSMAGFSAYYYYSPLNFITLLFPNEMLPVAESVVILLTAAFSSLSMSVLLYNKYEGSLRSVIFSTAYAMCGFSATYFQLTMYAGNMIIFPLIILGFLRFIEDPQKKYLYIFTLAAAIIFNYYSAFMVCLFLMMLFMGECILGKVKKESVPVFFLSSLTAVMLSAFTLFPAVRSLTGEKNSFSLGFFRTFSVTAFPRQFFAGSFKGNISTGLPNVFCGVIVLLLFLLFLFNKRIPIKERLLSLGIFFFLILNFWINSLNIIWHGLNQPIGFPYRYSYLLSFVMIICAHREFNSLCSYKEEKGIRIKALFALIAVLEIADLTYNYYDVMNYFSLASLSEYQRFLKDTGDRLEVCREDSGSADELYRIEKYYRRTNNDAMQFNYAGLSHFSSSEKKDKINFMGKLGFRNNGNWSFYNETTTDFLESFFGVKYILSQFSSTPNKYVRIFKDSDISVFRNENALPLIFNTTDTIRDINYNGYNGDPFRLQEAIADSLNGKENHIFEKAEILSKETENLDAEERDGFIHYKKKDESKDAWIEVKIRVNSPDKNLFAYFDAPETENAELFKDGVTFGEYFSRYRWNIISFHRTKKSDETTIRLRLTDNSLDLGNMYFYFEDRDRVKALMDEVKENDSSLRKITSSYIIGNISVPEKGRAVTLTIPYDSGWTVLVDGVKTNTKRAAGILMSFDAEPGEHEIVMKYRPIGSLPGVMFMLLGVIFLIFDRKRRIIFALKKPEK